MNEEELSKSNMKSVISVLLTCVVEVLSSLDLNVTHQGICE
jgi:hypothetical protein